MPLSKEDYLKSAAEAQVGFLPTQDAADPTVGKTVQSDGGVPATPAGIPGQVFDVRQLPNPDVAKAAGVPPVQIHPDLIIEGAKVGEHTQGPGITHLAELKSLEKLGYPVLADDGSVVKQEDNLKPFVQGAVAAKEAPEAKETPAA